MTVWGRGIRCAAAVAGATALLAGCGPSGGGGNSGTPSAGQSSASATPTVAQTVPTAINGCQLPQSFITAEHLDSDPNKSDTQNGSAIWRGCVWSTYNGDGYGLDVSTTNLTIPMVQANTRFKVVEQLTIDGRQAITFQNIGQKDLRAACLIHVEMKGGGLEFSVDNPASGKATGTQDSCEIAKKLAADLVPMIPASA
ncbi:DUF3558 domain-containing protein [Nocardia sp. NEAU-G5]|uniref:DUF3558 domain-containing protein n=1 Tax=Nocardia albiluteola TaxID=2842303 RepID=A0ABS6BCK5_9NOCA|nr:DUF3558 domain-containing protein [Nocardia albiluteola]MBU3068014.1 DUF3558 domain-containing protein [Nocardia albiluteola]